MGMLVSLNNRRMLCKTPDPFVIVFSSLSHFWTKINECSRFVFQMISWFWMKTESDQKTAWQKGPRFTIRFFYMTTIAIPPGIKGYLGVCRVTLNLLGTYRGEKEKYQI